MSIALLGETAANSTSSPVVVSRTTTAGALLVAFCGRNAASDVFTAVTDTAGNTWIRAAFAPASGSVGRRMEIWYCENALSITSISAAFTGTSASYVSLHEFSGVAATGALDMAFAKFQSGTTSPTAAEVTPSEADELVIGAIRANSGGTQVYTLTSTGWTASTLPGTDNSAVAYYIGPTAGAATGPVWTLGTAAGSGSATAAFKAAAIPAGPVKVWNGSSWTVANPTEPIKYWDGSSWVVPPAGKIMVWNGAGWDVAL